MELLSLTSIRIFFRRRFKKKSRYSFSRAADQDKFLQLLQSCYYCLLFISKATRRSVALIRERGKEYREIKEGRKKGGRGGSRG